VKVREADIGDKIRWDSFVDNECGDFYLYFDWKYIYESLGYRFIPLMIENDSSQILGILPLAKHKKFLYSILESIEEGGGGFLLKKELSESEKYEIIRSLVKHVDRDYSKGCSRLYIRKSILYLRECTDISDTRFTVPEKALIDSGLKYNFNETTGFPCTHVLELKQPFEEHIWRGLWSHNLRNRINKAVRNGVTVLEDKEFKYKDIFIDMLNANYRRRSNKRDIKDETKAKFDIFKDKTKLFIALQDGQPIAGLLCLYTPSICQLTRLGSYSRDTGNSSTLCVKVAIEDACNAGYRFCDFGMSTEPSVAFFKSKFGSVQVPIGIYKKTYSFPRNRAHQASQLLEVLREDKMYLWKNRKKLLKKLVNARE
jgi:hypothetical protein